MAISGKMMLWIVGLSLGTFLALERYRNAAPTGNARLGVVRKPA